MNSSKERMEKQLRDACQPDGVVKETEESSILHLTSVAFADKMRQEENGQALLDLLERGEWRICERMCLSHAYVEDGVAYIDVPGWNNLVAHLTIVNSV